jgi:hypothetical protein
MQSFLEKLFGPSWRTSTTGLIETAILLGGAWLALPEATRSDPKVFIPALVAALVKTLKDLQTKDKAVSGNATQGYMVAEKGETKIIPPTP